METDRTAEDHDVVDHVEVDLAEDAARLEIETPSALTELRRAAVVVAVLAWAHLRALFRMLQPGRHRPLLELFAEGVADAFEDLGPTFVKIGQLITSSPDLFPKELVEACRRHLYAARPVPAAAIRAAIRADLRRPVEQLFETFDDIPLAAASVAQVHACTLPGGEEVVVKVQRPDIAQGMVVDLHILARLARLIDRIPQAKSANLPGLVADLHAVTIRELDFREETEAQRKFAANLHAFGDNHMVKVPQIHPELCGARTITMERLHGEPLDEYAKRLSGDKEGEALLRRTLKPWLEAVIVHGPFHADMHGGNIWVLTDGRIAFLDFGISGELAEGWREIVSALFYGMAFDAGFDRLAAATKAVGAIPEEAGSDEQVGQLLERLIVPLLAPDPSQVELSMGELLQSLTEAFGQFGVKVPNELLLIAKQLIYLEGYTSALSPQHQLLTDLYLLQNVHPEQVKERVAAGAGDDWPD